MQLYAKIKKSSEYTHQNISAERDPRFGLPFPVTIDAEKCYGNGRDDYAVQGGPGGQYRLSDVTLYIKRADGQPIRIS